MTRRGKRRLGGTVLVIALTGVALWAMYALVLPRIVRAQVVEALARLGVSNVSFDLRNASLWNTQLARRAPGRP
jgi:hypothetical protein